MNDENDQRAYFLNLLKAGPTSWHASAHMAKTLNRNGFQYLAMDQPWQL